MNLMKHYEEDHKKLLNDVLEAPEVKLELEEPVTFAPNDLY